MRAAGLTLVLSTAACATPDLYSWGRYEDSIAAMYATSSGYDPAAEVARLSQQVEETAHRGQRVPPGLRAHIGFLLIEAGNAERGVQYLRAEKEAFPESSVFVDGILARYHGNEP
ncbi:MAG: DUF4810 domain-containing protein [Planctomycetota bacterium]